MKNIRKSRGQEGSTLAETMVAMFILGVGCLVAMNMVIVSLNANSRTKHDSTSVALAEMVMDQISAIPVGSSTTSLTVTDCASNSSTINLSGSSSGTGANLSSGAIDFTQASTSVTSGYQMSYTVCGVSNGLTAIYDVRWNITTVPSGKAEFVVVGARYMYTATGSAGAGQRFAPAFSMASVVGE
jgi:Tfp pilus assembly protein PilV